MNIYCILCPISDNSGAQDRAACRQALLAAHRKAARHALEISLKRSGLTYPKRRIETTGQRNHVVDGVHVSLSHQRFLAGAIAAPFAVGIDIQYIEARRHRRLWSYVADSDEWALVDRPPDWEWFHRFWTAKEAIYKAAGVGIAQGRSVTQIVSVRREPDGGVRMRATGLGASWDVIQKKEDGYIISVALPLNQYPLLRVIRVDALFL